MKKIDSHTHPFQTIRGRDGVVSYAESAVKLGFDGIVFTEHAPIRGCDNRHFLNEAELEEYITLAQKCRDEYKEKIEITVGLECDYIPENMEYLSRILKEYPVQYVAGSLHLHGAYWKPRVSGMDSAALTRYALHLTLDMVNTGIYHTLTHMDFFRWITPEYHPEYFEEEFRSIFEAMVKNNVALEWNSSGFLKNFNSALPCRQVWDWSLDYPLKRVFGSDAHSAELIGSFWDEYVKIVPENPAADL